MHDPAAYTGTNYLLQAEAARRASWIEFHASYPLLPLSEHPGPRPGRWRYFARRRWEKQRDLRQAAKAWNFGALYGANIEQFKQKGIAEVIVVDDATGASLRVREGVVIYNDNFPFITQDAWEQMFLPKGDGN
jgi:hypothetical protein